MCQSGNSHTLYHRFRKVLEIQRKVSYYSSIIYKYKPLFFIILQKKVINSLQPVYIRKSPEAISSQSLPRCKAKRAKTHASALYNTL